MIRSWPICMKNNSVLELFCHLHFTSKLNGTVLCIENGCGIRRIVKWDNLKRLLLFYWIKYLNGKKGQDKRSNQKTQTPKKRVLYILIRPYKPGQNRKATLFLLIGRFEQSPFSYFVLILISPGHSDIDLHKKQWK